MLAVIAGATALSTLFGGLFALRFKDKLHLILGFSAGAVLGVAFFDLLPEALELISGSFKPSSVFLFVAIGFFFFMILDRVALLHSHETENDESCHNENHHQTRGLLGASSLSLHSVLDGLAIGLSFQVSAAVGVVVALAVLAHDFSDGINTVNIVSKNGGNKIKAFRWLIVDALAPVFGIIISLFFTLPAGILGAVLAVCAGFFLYIGASDLLPESHHAHPKFITILTTLLGAGLLYTVVTLAGI
jgi:ZIP family zinc transporter